MNKSKYTQKYGMNLKMMAWKLGVSESTAYNMLKQDESKVTQQIAEMNNNYQLLESLTTHRRKCSHCGQSHIYYYNRQDYCKLRLHEAYRNMIKRCYDPRIHKYEYYGGRGIQVCPEWKKSKRRFEEWALVNGYQDDLTIDRVDNNKDYFPQNCQWVDWETNYRKDRK